MSLSRQIDDRQALHVTKPEEEKAARPGFDSLAARAIDVLVSRRNGCGALSERRIGELHDAVVGPDPLAHRAVVSDMLAAGIPAAEICDRYVPAVARRLGEEWSEDSMSFAQVSIGSARLQALLRDVALDPPREALDDPEPLAVMVVADAHHTLGAMVLTGQLRRCGASVRLVLGQPDEEVHRLLAGSAFDAVLISVACADDFSVVKSMVTMLREATRGNIPFVVGGGILELGVAQAMEVTGADHATSDTGEALRLIGDLVKMRQER